MIVRGESTIIDDHVPFDQGFRKELFTDCMVFGMLIAKRNSAMVVISGRSRRSGHGNVGTECLLVPMHVLLDI